jgi:hypothetical protein
MEKDSSVARELICLASNIIKEVCIVLHSLNPMLLRFYHHLHPVVEFESEFVEQIVYANHNLDIFEMVA